MAGKGKKFVKFNLLIAHNILFLGIEEIINDTVNYDLSDKCKNKTVSLISHYKSTDIENFITKKDYIEKLSSEAKDIIKIIFNSPEEFLNSITTEKYNCISKRLLKNKLISIGWQRKVVDSAFKELRELTKILDS